MKLNKGSYILVINIKKPVKIKIGSLGSFEFLKGYYVYVGSAMNNLNKRIERHLKTSKKGQNKKHWHIDYLLSSFETIIKGVYYKESDKKEECFIAEKISKISQGEIKGFGSSDCKCKSHLFKFSKRIINKLEGFNKMKLYFLS